MLESVVGHAAVGEVEDADRVLELARQREDERRLAASCHGIKDTHRSCHDKLCHLKQEERNYGQMSPLEKIFVSRSKNSRHGGVDKPGLV